jgi:hypothetical protein
MDNMGNVGVQLLLCRPPRDKELGSDDYKIILCMQGGRFRAPSRVILFYSSNSANDEMVGWIFLPVVPSDSHYVTTVGLYVCRYKRTISIRL